MPDPDRRDALKLLAAGGATLVVACTTGRGRGGVPDPVITVQPLPPAPSPWPTLDPFLFCVHHDDRYPAGNEQLGPAASLDGRRLGHDFGRRDGWSMYHGETVPGFPAHPHRGFETVTVVRRGLLDHADSMGAAARYGGGDVQWLTAGAGILHAEMFPLVQRATPNPVELFQIWLNLPAADKFSPPHFTMLWNDRIPRALTRDRAGRTTTVTTVAGAGAPPPPPYSWAARRDTAVAIQTIALSPGAHHTLPAAPDTDRMLYFFAGDTLRIAGTPVASSSAVHLRADLPVPLEAGASPVELLLLQGRPIAEPVVSHGPFVMNTRAEIDDAIADFRATQFGGWPWPASDPTHGLEPTRFARHADGRLDRPT